MSQVQRVAEFDTWRPGYAGAEVDIFLPGTTTRAEVFYDAALTSAAPNPQTLQSNTVDEIGYGKFTQTIYVGTPYYLRIDGAEATGVVRPPMTSLVGEDASEAVATAAIGTAERAIEDWLSDEIRIEAWGEFGANATTNTSILASGIGAAAAQGGGEVLLPSGNIDFNTLSLPAGVILRGRGQAPTVLRSTQGEHVVTLAGAGSGLRNITLDGVSLTEQSIGLYGVGVISPALDGVQIKRFEKGIELRGVTSAAFDNLYITNCTIGGEIRGDTNAGDGSDGSAVDVVRWSGGRVGECVDGGLLLTVEDAENACVALRGVRFVANVGPALDIRGAQMVLVEQCSFSGNTAALSVANGEDDDESPAQQILFRQTVFNGGTLSFDGACVQVVFERCNFRDADMVLGGVEGTINLVDCIEDALTTSTGVVDRLLRVTTDKVQEAFGVTTDATPLVAWSRQLRPYEVCRANARVLGKAMNGNASALYEFVAIAYRPADEVNYDLASVAIPVGHGIVGRTSGATATIVLDTPAGGGTGEMRLADTEGAFIVSEMADFSTGGECRLVGAVTPQDVDFYVAQEQLEPNFENDTLWGAEFVANSTSLQVEVTGATGATVHWSVEVNLFKG